MRTHRMFGVERFYLVRTDDYLHKFPSINHKWVDLYTDQQAPFDIWRPAPKISDEAGWPKGILPPCGPGRAPSPSPSQSARRRQWQRWAILQEGKGVVGERIIILLIFPKNMIVRGWRELQTPP